MDFARMKIYHLNMSSGIMRLRALSELVKKKGDDFMNNWDELYFHGLIPTFDSYHDMLRVTGQMEQFNVLKKCCVEYYRYGIKKIVH